LNYSDAVTQASWLPQIESVLKDFNVSMTTKRYNSHHFDLCPRKNIDVCLFINLFRGSWHLKINLNPSEWNNDDAKNIWKIQSTNCLLGSIAFMALLV
jgi:phenylacetate-CoA ligase